MGMTSDNQSSHLLCCIVLPKGNTIEQALETKDNTRAVLPMGLGSAGSL